MYVIDITLFVTANHHGISKDTGFANIKVYRYFDQETRGLDIEGMKSDLSVCSLHYNIYVLENYFSFKSYLNSFQGHIPLESVPVI